MKKIALLALLVSLFFSAFLGFTQIPKHDDIFAIENAYQLQEKGKLQIYWGEEEAYKYEEGKKTGWVSGLNHPPLYYLLLAIFTSLDKHLFLFRLFGIISHLFTLLLLWFLAKKCFVEYKKIFFIGLLTYILTPVAVQQSVLLSIDTSIYPLTLYLFLFVFIKNADKMDTNAIFLLSILFGLALFTKYTTSLFLLPPVFLYYVSQKKYGSAWNYCSLILGGGLFIFLGAMLVFTHLQGLDFLYVLRFTLFTRVIATIHLFRNLGTTLMYDTFWMSLPFLLFFGIACIKRCIEYKKRKKIDKGDIILLFVLMGYLTYSLKAPNIYYKFPFFPLMALFAGELLSGQILSRVIVVVFGIFFPMYLWTGFDPLLVLPSLLPLQQSSLPILLSLFFYLLPSIASIAFFRHRKIFYSLLFGIMLAMNLSLLLHQVRADYSTINVYGEKGYEETISYVKPQLSGDDRVISRWDMGYLLGVPFYQDESFTERNLCGIETMHIKRAPSTCGFLDVAYRTNSTAFLYDQRVRFFIHSSYFQELDKGLRKDTLTILDKEYKLDKTFGHFMIYRHQGE